LNGRVPLIGFSGSPWTLACYMVEGAGSDDYRLVKTMLYSRPDLMHRMLEINADAVRPTSTRQIERRRQGRDDLRQLGRRLADGAFQEFSLAYTARVLRQLNATRTVPRFRASCSPRAAGLWLAEMGALDCEVLGVDWTVNLARARAAGGRNKALQAI
jgi:uroporphyrinogen decarboxylase